MTSVLEEIRRLDEARDRGEIDETTYLSVRRTITDLIEDADVVDEIVPDDDPAFDQLWSNGLWIAAGFLIAVGLGGWLIGDFMMALTLSVAVLALFITRAAQKLVAEDHAPDPEEMATE